MEMTLPEYLRRLEKNDPEEYKKFIERLASEGFILIERLKKDDPEQYEKVLARMKREGFARVVRCKDCRYTVKKAGMIICINKMLFGEVDPMWFCADGDAKENGGSKDGV